MNSKEIRKKFIEYFHSLGHNIFASDSLIPTSDPTLLFTTAGMVQFKDYFLGKKTGVKRACSVQKCLRTSDIEKVGHTSRHLTFFEMLGNFSFGDYFKKEAIEWCWEFITKVVCLDKNKLYITVYKDDEEAYQIWCKIISENKIYKLSEETNFWKMGETGPCGPCSEILYDLGKQHGCGKPDCSPACDCDRFIEVWNLVFTQFDLQQDGKLIPLKQKNIDTGMGLERLCMVVNNLNSVFDTDLFLPIKQQLLNYLNPDITNSTKLINYINAISDHVRAATFAISEGVIPTTEGRGYVIRKIIRRAVRYLKLLNHNEPLLYKLVPKVVNLMKDYYPELELHREKVAVIVKSEEEKFLETLDEGLKLIDEIIKTGKTKIDGSVVFKLYDTYGFPKELVDEILKENKITYNDLEFYEAEAKAKEIAKQSWHGVKVVDTSVYLSFPKTNFVGYQQLVSSSVILGMIKNGQKINTATKGDTVEVLFDTTPFYGESGGQIGDTGFVKLKDKNKLVGKIKDTKKFEERIVHIVELIDDIKQTDEVLLEVDISRRKDIMRHHTATHLLHKALRETLGEHAIQSGSLVSDEYFRFDFVHWQALTEEEIYRIEKIVNQKIFECLPVSIIYTNINTAKKLGAVALFEEKYAQEVRMVVIGGKIENDQIIQQPYSIELCGGTHCSNTAEIGIFKILSESSVGANIRRIEAICGQKVYEYITNLKHTLHSVATLLGTNDIAEIKNKIEKLIQQNKKLQQELENVRLNLTTKNVEEFNKEINGIKILIKHLSSTELKFLRTISDELAKKYENEPFVVVIYSTDNQKIAIVVRTNEKLPSVFKAKNVAEKLSKKFNIQFGGREDFVQGGGSIKEKISPDILFEIITQSQ